jgi:hypothetical protein
MALEDFKCRFLGGEERERVKGLLKVCLLTIWALSLTFLL